MVSAITPRSISTNRHLCSIGNIFLVIALLTILVTSNRAAAASLVHKPAPEISRRDLQKHKVALSAFRGKVVLLDFWATWCAPCLVEMPHLAAWQKQYGPRGLQIVGVSMDDDEASARKVYEKKQLNYPVVMGDEKLGRLYGGILGLPVIFLIDRKGVIQAQFQGETNPHQIEEQIIKLIK
jgi:cytochrome c biogenesis protein CcmG, thiol:disulfide interchange protein DsbE